MVWICPALAGLSLSLWALFWLSRSPQDRSFLGFRGILARGVERRFGGYEHRFGGGDEGLPERLDRPRRALVIGGGLAGIAAAWVLAQRGFTVVLREGNPYLGGKIGAWTVPGPTGERLPVEHGFHAFFRHYYNLNRFLDQVGARPKMKAIDDYLILGADGTRQGFQGVDTAPIINLVSLWLRGVYRAGDILFTPALHHMDVFLQYDAEKVEAKFDDVDYARFAKEAHLPASLRRVFNTFSRAFFADEDKMSMGELLKSFHFYYLSHDKGLTYDFPADHYESSLLGPIQAHLESAGTEIRLSSPVSAIRRDGEGWDVDGEPFDQIVIAASIPGLKSLVDHNPDLAGQDGAFAERIANLKVGQRYAVLRMWIDRDIPSDLPPYFITDRVRILDAIAAYHRIEAGCADWARRHGGAVIEVHCYALPDDLSDDAVRDQFVAELTAFVPSLAGFVVHHQDLQIRKDFPAFHVGQARFRPGTDPGVPGLSLAGDWVKLPIPAMLMEGAFTSGIFAANRICAAEGLRGWPVWTVPLKGFLPAD